MRAAVMFILALATIGNGCAPVNQATRPTTAQMDQVRRLAVVVIPETEFTVIKERRGATAAAMSGMAFGVVGVLVAAGVHSGITTEKDKAHAAGVSLHVTDLEPQRLLTDSLIRTLASGDRFSDIRVLPQAPVGDAREFDGVLVVKLPAWGLVVVARDPDLMSGFVELGVTMTSGGSAILEETYTALGRDRHPLEMFKTDAALTRRELTETLRVAGQRLAYELLYPRGTQR
jgi:hypothetical protein